MRWLSSLDLQPTEPGLLRARHWSFKFVILAKTKGSLAKPNVPVEVTFVLLIHQP